MIDLSNKRFNRLLVLCFSHSNKQGRYWKCLCDCGNECIVSTKHITRNATQSCGCLQKERAREAVKINEGDNVRNVLYSEYRYKARKRSLSFELTKPEFYELISKECFYCGELPKYYIVRNANGGIYKNGIDRLDNSKGYLVENCVSCCKDCNTMKMADSYSDFIERCKRIVERHKDGV